MNYTRATTEQPVIICSIEETTYYDGSSWVEYPVGKHFGYEVTYGDYQDDDPTALSEWSLDHLINKPSINVCTPYLARLIQKARQSENEMCYVEYGDIHPKHVDLVLYNLKKEVETLGLQDYVVFHVDDCLITVFGGVITKFLF